MRRLYSRIYVHMLFVLVAAAVAVALVSAVGWHGEYQRGIAHRLTLFAADLVAERLHDPESLAVLLERLDRDLEVDVTLRQPDGTLLSATSTPLPAMSADELAAARKGEWIFVRGRHGFAAAPVRRSGGTVVAVLQATWRRDPAPPLVRPFAHLAAVLIVIGLVALPLSHRISRPVARLTEAVRRFGDGELHYRIETRRRGRAGRHRLDELGRLELAWNAMAERIETLVVSHRELLANVSHELRSPLARLRVLLELLPQEVGQERIADVERELRDLDRLIDAVLTLARLEAAELPVAKEAVAVRALLASVRRQAENHPMFSGQAVSLRAPHDLFVRGDEALLRRALWNLLENAAKYGAPPVELFAETSSGDVVIGVIDLGPGIPEHERERVVRAFERGERARAASPEGGYGLGLTLASRIARAHGGGLSIEATATDASGEHGCRVGLVLPRDASAKTPPRPLTSPDAEA